MSTRSSQRSPRGSKAAVAPSREMSATGQSKETKAGHANQTKIFNQFLDHAKSTAPDLFASWTSPATFEDLPESVLREREIWGHFATFLCETCVSDVGKKKGKLVAHKTAHGYWGGVLNQARMRLSKSTERETTVRTSARLLFARIPLARAPATCRSDRSFPVCCAGFLSRHHG